MTERRLSDLARALVLFANFALVILAYYQVKPASRSLYLEHFTAAQLPYAWLGSAAMLVLLMPLYARLVDRLPRVTVVIGSCALFAALLVVFRFTPGGPGPALAFYVLVDILSVVLVEQFWSLTNSAFTSQHGRRWYGLIAAGGLAGGLVGGLIAAQLVARTSLTTLDLLLVGAGLIMLIALMSAAMARRGLFVEQPAAERPPGLPDNPRRLDWVRNPYLLTITAILLLAQVVEPVVEYQFLHFVQASYPEREARTVFLSNILSLLGGLALTVNLLITPLVLRRLGALGGLLFQPLALIVGSGAYLAVPGLVTGGALKIADRGLSYSMNRPAKELLYVPVAPALIYKSKAWIDMFGYRAFKVISAVGILALTEWSGLLTDPQAYSPFVMAVALVWICLVVSLARPYRELTELELERLTVKPG